MSATSARRVAQGLAATFVVAYATGLTLIGLAPEQIPYSAASEAPFLLTNLAFVAVGLLIVSSHPRNAVGWLLIASAIGESLWNLSIGYAAFGLSEDLPGAVAAAWLAEWVSTLGPGFIGLTVLLFPTGRLPSPRWRPVAWLLVATTVANSATIALAPGRLGDVPSVTNPVGLGWLEGASSRSSCCCPSRVCCRWACGTGVRTPVSASRSSVCCGR